MPPMFFLKVGLKHLVKDILQFYIYYLIILIRYTEHPRNITTCISTTLCKYTSKKSEVRLLNADACLKSKMFEYFM